MKTTTSMLKKITAFFAAAVLLLTGTTMTHITNILDTSITVSAADNGTGNYRVNTGAGLNIRSGPGTGYSKLGAAANGTQFTVTQTQNGWGYGSIKCTNGTRNGWACLQYCAFLGRPNNEKSVNYQVIITTKAGLNVRAQASASSGWVTAIPYNKVVTVTKESNGWGYTNYNGRNGWICLQYTARYTQPTPSSALAKLQSKFPAGKYWNHAGSSKNNPDGWTNTPCTHHGHCSRNGYGGSCGCNSFNGIAIQCFGFAYKCGYDAFNSSPANWKKVYNLNSLKAGDIVRYKNNGHSIFVTAVNGNTVTYGDCNSDGHCKIRWNQTISKSTLASTLTYVCVAPRTLS